MSFKLSPSKETRKKISDTLKKKYATGEIKAPKYWLGKKQSKEACQKRAASHMGKKQSVETILKRVAKLKGKNRSLEQRKRISEGTLAAMSNSQTRLKMSLAKRGKPPNNKGKLFSKEARASMSKSQKYSYEKGRVSHRKGIHLSEKTKTLLRLKNLGKKHLAITKIKISNKLKGQKRTTEQKQKISDSKKGDKNYNWQGGKSFEPYGIKFNKGLKQAIRYRDNYRCQECFRHESELRTKNNKQYKLHIHHIDYNKQNNSPENLICLCRNCHQQTNFKRENWIKYFKSKMEVKA